MAEGWSFYNDFWNFGDGSNLRSGTNPTYDINNDFLATYPQFGMGANGTQVVPPATIQMFIDLANTCIQQPRFRGAWQMAMGLFIAHHCHLWLQAYIDPNNGASAVAEAGRAQGVVTSQSVGDVSESVDVSNAMDPAWGDLNLTVYGQQLIRYAKLYGKGGSYIW